MTHSTQAHRRLATIVCGAALAVMTSLPASASEDFIRVFMDHARILKLDRIVSKVIIGNADVADVAISDPQTIVLTGKSYGTTNLVILDQAGEAIVDERILVSVDEANTLRVFKQTSRSVYSCTPACEEHVPTAAATSP